MAPLGSNGLADAPVRSAGVLQKRYHLSTEGGEFIRKVKKGAEYEVNADLLIGANALRDEFGGPNRRVLKPSFG